MHIVSMNGSVLNVFPKLASYCASCFSCQHPCKPLSFHLEPHLYWTCHAQMWHSIQTRPNNVHTSRGADLFFTCKGGTFAASTCWRTCTNVEWFKRMLLSIAFCCKRADTLTASPIAV